MMAVEGYQLTEGSLMLYRQLSGQMALRDYTRVSHQMFGEMDLLGDYTFSVITF